MTADWVKIAAAIRISISVNARTWSWKPATALDRPGLHKPCPKNLG